MKYGIVGITVAALAGAAWAKVELATPFADGMVLQRDRAVNVWGTADAGEKVTVAFAGNEVSATADAAGAWRLQLPAMPASKEGRMLSVKGATDEIRLADVLVGEVWFCAGQSNAELPLVGDNPHFSDRQGRLVAQMTRKPLVRYVYASDYRFSLTPKTKATYPVEWKPFTPENLGKAPSFSAMGVYFALELFSALDIPIGIVGTYWGGTNIDAWTPREGYAGKDGLAEEAEWKGVPAEEWKDELHKHGPVIAPKQQPCVLWNEMVEPWCPMTMRGFIWYQGCHNSGEGARYCAKMHALYDGWSKKFENPELKLYFVQLAPFECSWWELQLSQARFAAEERNAGMVTSGDVGNSTDIHPNEKGTLGKRLAAMALSRDYGFDIEAEAPVLKAVCSEEGRIIMRFDHAEGWYAYDPAWGVDFGFEVAGEDGVWHRAWLVNANDGKRVSKPWDTVGRIAGRDLVVAADEVEKPTKVRYLYSSPWISALHAFSGLPLGPFEAEVR